jgi:hypothetical protein
MSCSLSESIFLRLSRFETSGCGEVAEWPKGKLSGGEALRLRAMTSEAYSLDSGCRFAAGGRRWKFEELCDCMRTSRADRG